MTPFEKPNRRDWICAFSQLFWYNVVAISATNVSVQARGCGTRCLEARIAELQAQIAQLNASTVKLGQIVTINYARRLSLVGWPDAGECLLGATTLRPKHLEPFKTADFRFGSIACDFCLELMRLELAKRNVSAGMKAGAHPNAQR